MKEREILFNAIKTLLIKANTVLDKEVYECIEKNMSLQGNEMTEVIQDKLDMQDQITLDCFANVRNDIPFILQNAYLASKNNRPLCQDTGQVIVFIKLPYYFSFDYDFKKVINDAVEETYKQECYRKSVVKNAVFDRCNTKTNTPAIIYTEFENRESVKIDILIKGGGAENMSFVEMFNPTATEDEIISKLSEKIKERAKNACPPLFIGIGAGGTMDYAALLSKKALFEGVQNEFCEKLTDCCNERTCCYEESCTAHPICRCAKKDGENMSLRGNEMTEVIQDNLVTQDNHTLDCHGGFQSPRNDNIVLSVKMLSTSTHIASLPVAVTVNCHSNRHAGCEIGKNGVFYNDIKYDISPINIDLTTYKKVNTKNIDEIKKLKAGDKILLSGTIYTMRDAAHKKIFELIENKEKLPFEINNSVIFYAGPAPEKEGEIIGPIGPTTAKRMDKYAPLLYDMGCLVTIGKGVRSKEVFDACIRNKAHYFSALGGIACYLQKSFKKTELIAFKELGTEAIRKFEIEDLPLTVEI